LLFVCFLRVRPFDCLRRTGLRLPKTDGTLIAQDGWDFDCPKRMGLRLPKTDGTSVAQGGWDFNRLLRAGLRLLVIVGGGFIAFPLDSAPLRITAKSLPIPASPAPPNSHPNLARKSVDFPLLPLPHGPSRCFSVIRLLCPPFGEVRYSGPEEGSKISACVPIFTVRFLAQNRWERGDSIL
jgi:hypothetical protein